MKNGNISVSKCAKELGIDIDTVLEILTRLEKSKSKNAIVDSNSVFAEQEKDYAINNQANVSIPLEQEKDYSIADLIKSGESSTLEFKSSMLLPTQKDPTISLLESKITDTISKEDKEKFEKAIKEKEKALKEEIPFMIVKTIAAFLNSDGGILLVGVKDDGSIYGLEKDFQAVPNNRKNLDGWLQYLVELINNQIGTEFIQYIRVKPIHYEGKTIVQIIVEKSSRPAYVEKKDVEFYIRSLNTSRPLNTREANNYILDHWKKF